MPTCKTGGTTITSPFAFPAGVTTVTCSAMNSQGLTGMCSFTVTVAPLNVCIQVNLGGEASKGGVPAADVPALAAAVAALPSLSLRGLMCIPPEESDPARQREWFARLRALRDSLNAGGLGLDTLSMGMSGDFEAAIQEGATLIRVGTAIFGPRPAIAPRTIPES